MLQQQKQQLNAVFDMLDQEKRQFLLDVALDFASQLPAKPRLHLVVCSSATTNDTELRRIAR